MSKNENTFPISKDDITFYGDTEKERKANEEIFDMSLIIAQKDDEIRALSKEIERLNNIIKETIEYIKEYGDTENIFIPTNISHKTSIELLEILDKENK